MLLVWSSFFYFLSFASLLQQMGYTYSIISFYRYRTPYGVVTTVFFHRDFPFSFALAVTERAEYSTESSVDADTHNTREYRLVSRPLCRSVCTLTSSSGSYCAQSTIPRARPLQGETARHCLIAPPFSAIPARTRCSCATANGGWSYRRWGPYLEPSC